jgi:hypothetical protein
MVAVVKQRPTTAIHIVYSLQQSVHSIHHDDHQTLRTHWQRDDLVCGWNNTM